MRPQNRHWLSENAAERSPRRLCFYDTEGLPQDHSNLQTLRLWVARHVLRKSITPSLPRERQSEGHTAQHLADFISNGARSDTPLYVCAHGASYDLTITRLPLLLLERGWELGQHALMSGEPWAHFHLGEKTIRLIDSHSFLPRSLEEIGDRIGIPKRSLPDFDAPDEEWFERCRQDVEIMTRAMLEFLDWWDRHRLGAFADTGPGSGWHVMRHRKAPDKVLIDPEPEGRAWDRQALYGGRRDCWQKGLLSEGWYVELDLVQAHLGICATQALPILRGAHFDSLPLDTYLLNHLAAGVIAECEIETETPRYPLRLQGAITYPVGSFRTVLCSPELAHARQLGELRAIDRGRRYRLGFAMEGWGNWIQRILSGDQPDTPVTAQIAAKGWSRTVPGRWAMRTGRQDFELPSASRSWGVTWGRDHPSGAPRTILTIGGRELWLLQDQEADSSFPAVLAWVQSHTRVLLDRLISALPPGAVILCNTDGVLVKLEELYAAVRLQGWRLTGYTQARELADACAGILERETAPIRLQVKAVYRQGEVIGAQHTILDGRRKLAGVATRAQEIRPKVYTYETWPRLAWQMAQGSSRGYVNGQASVDLSEVKVPRWEYEDGCCEPLRLDMWPTRHQWWASTPAPACERHQSPLQAAQHPALTKVLEGPVHDMGAEHPALPVGGES